MLKIFSILIWICIFGGWTCEDQSNLNGVVADTGNVDIGNDDNVNNEGRKVRAIYFIPNDVNHVQDQHYLDSLIRVQKLYKDEMIRHGYGEKTFEFELDNDGNILTTQINGNHPSDYYQYVTFKRLMQETPDKFKDRKYVHIFIIAGVEYIEGGALGRGRPTFNEDFGGVCLVADSTNVELYKLIAHEIGHAFSLYHTHRRESIMSKEGLQLLQYEARWINNHPFFNPSKEADVNPPKVNSVSFETGEKDIINILCNITDDNQLYQVMIMDQSTTVVDFKYVKSNNADIVFPIYGNNRRYIKTLTFMVMDESGAFTHEKVDFDVPQEFLQ